MAVITEQELMSNSAAVAGWLCVSVRAGDGRIEVIECGREDQRTCDHVLVNTLPRLGVSFTGIIATRRVLFLTWWW